MKTLTKKLFAAVLMLMITASSVMTTFASDNNINLGSGIVNVPSFNKIWVSGNVRIVLKQGDKESIEAGENFNPKTTSVQSKGQTIYINSTEVGSVTLNITIKDLQRIEACGSAVVTSANNLNVKHLQLFINQSAKIRVSANAETLYTVVKDRAVLKINGSASQHSMVAANMKNIKFNNFYCANTKQYATQAIMDADKTAFVAR